MAGETVDRKEVLKQAFVKALPITGSYLFVSMAYGLTMQDFPGSGRCLPA